jgi:uncharacterized protein YaiE (UPF0345 family)
MPRIAILGWGSLIPCPGDLSIRGNWYLDGPVVSIEFSRKSADGRLTLVIDTQRGSTITTQYAESTHVVVEDAVDNLRRREGTTVKNIGVCGRDGSDTRSSNHPEVLLSMAAWLNSSNFDVVLWADLESNFAVGQNREQFLESAIAYLNGLAEVCKANARDYINRAPAQTATALRQELRSRGWL